MTYDLHCVGVMGWSKSDRVDTTTCTPSAMNEGQTMNKRRLVFSIDTSPIGIHCR
jgi:hypothetical protein